MHHMSRGFYLDSTFSRRRRRTWWPWVAAAIAITTTLVAQGDLLNLIFGRP